MAARSRPRQEQSAPSPSSDANDPAAAAGSSPASPDASEGFFAGDGRGPVFDPEHEPEAGPAPLGPEPPQVIEVAWEVATVRTILETKGHVLHQIVGKGADDWIYTRDELAAIAPPLTNILNRYPVTQAAAGTGDELALIIGLGGYTLRSWTTRREALAAERDEHDGDPVRGAPVFGTEPPPPPDPMAAQLAGVQQ